MICNKRPNAEQNFRWSSLFYYSVPPERLEIESEVGEEENSISNISCTARGIYPTPQGKLSWTEGWVVHTFPKRSFPAEFFKIPKFR